MFNISPAPAALAKRASNAFSSATVMFSRRRPPFGLGLSALIPPWSKAMCVRFTVLNETPMAAAIAGCDHPALAQQYHLNALTLCRRNFPVQHRLQLPDLGLAAFDHLSPSESDGQSESHHAPRRQFPSVSDKITVKTSIQSVMEAISGVPASDLNNSPVRCWIEPVPECPYDSLPGLALA